MVSIIMSPDDLRHNLALSMFAALALIATLYLLLIGEWQGVIILLAYAGYMALLTWLTIRVTRPVPTVVVPPPTRSIRIWLQLGLIIFVIIVTGLSTLRPPFWSALVEWAAAIGERIFAAEWVGGPGNAVANPVQYVVIPLLGLLLLGAQPAELGIRRGWRVWRACALWLALPVLIWMIVVSLGLLPLQTLARRLIGNSLQNGFFEEFLMRGALQTRLERFVRPNDGLVLQALIFSLWHIDSNTQMMDGNLLAGLASGMLSQAIAGLSFGIIFRRTQNLIAPSIAHVAMNVLGQTFG